MKRVLTTLLATLAVAAALIVAGIVSTAPARAASPGSGFGEWASSTRYGWHGSMLVGGVHTYCIFPGRPLPTGATEDRGISGDAAGLDPRRLTAINMLVSTYGQTDDPVQAASVGWAVKAIANWNETLHTFGYAGESLEGAIDWVFRHIAPEHNVAVQNLAAAYYAEGMAMAAGPASASGSLQFATDAADPRHGTVTVIADVPDARGTLTLENAVFTESGQPTLERAAVGATYPITATPPNGETTFTVRGSGTFRAGFAPLVHHFTTAGGQDTAGPVGPLDFPVAGEDSTPRVTTFAPVISTQVASRYVPGGTYIDDVTFGVVRGTWGRTGDGNYVPVRATATLYRTEDEPVLAPEAPADAEPVATLELTTDPVIGPTAPYRVETAEPLPGPGFYTAVWEIAAEGQHPDAVAALEADYAWREQFGEQSQITMVTAVSSKADPIVSVGDIMGDEVIVEGVVPRDGLDLSATVYRVPDGVDPVDACTPENLLWANPDDPVHVASAGSVRIPGPVVPDFGTYVWRERATDAQGRLVHEGACGVESETTRAPLPTVTTQATATVGWGGEATDAATVSGPVPRTGVTTLTFEVFHAAEGAAPADACTPERRVADTSATPVAVTTEGTFSSPVVRLQNVGTHYWIETLWHTPEGGEARQIARGACGLENETTVVEQPALTTRAVERAATGEPFSDTATVTGLGDGVDAELVFSIFHTAAGDEPVCTPETLEAVTDAVPVTGSGEYTSPTLTSSEAGAKHWVAELRTRPTDGSTPVTLAAGVCGEEFETTYVDVLAATGADGGSSSPIRTIGGIGAVVLAAGCALAALARRRTVTARR
ncbi:hypothetical protein LQ938_12070 [Microbacterium sp. cx-55]|uniref:hypothetical protein n=1 Tax=Microbacterium sp. cx-55 TaxID=2875948 RepID=UPI001CBCB74C|nr:hypothetical protein [Microbacterium sp. cx-55]MBZ4487993.1 hypothetical protein [Microbacterium sp. cx-55]UGB34600.1 hypothetical protein LQ938_12070 [Microbacterium sp. cx-55]